MRADDDEIGGEDCETSKVGERRVGGAETPAESAACRRDGRWRPNKDRAGEAEEGRGRKNVVNVVMEGLIQSDAREGENENVLGKKGWGQSEAR
jgi:hypothetical protein